MSRRVHAYCCFSLCVVRQPSTGCWLAVQETPKHNCEWWLPAGSVDPGESFPEAAHRETLEEAGLAIRLLGVLRVQHECLSPEAGYRMRVVFYGEPLEDGAPLKSVADAESTQARWCSTAELAGMQGEGVLRGDDLLNWAEYLEKGGAIFPLSVFGAECAGPGDPAEAAASAGGSGLGGGAAASASADLLHPPWASATLKDFQLQ